MLQVYVDSAAAATMECYVYVKLIQCMHEWAFVQMFSDKFGYLVLQPLTHTLTHAHTTPSYMHTPHTLIHAHTTPSHMHTYFTQGSHAEWYPGVLLNEEKLCQVL